jgi:hypothetical protein
MITSAVSFATGRCSSSPRRNSTLAAPTFAEFFARFFQHLIRHVDANDVASLTDLPGGHRNQI